MSLSLLAVIQYNTYQRYSAKLSDLLFGDYYGLTL